MPLVELLWRRETEGQTFDSPDCVALINVCAGRPAKFRIKTCTALQAIKDLRWDFLRAARSFKSGSTRNTLAWVHHQGSVLAAGEGDVALFLREAVILAILIRYPELVYEHQMNWRCWILNMGITSRCCGF